MPIYPHRIRLRGPWECEPLARLAAHPDGRIEKLEGPVPPVCRMSMPCRWREGGLGDFAGRVRFRRRFGYPGRIDAYERVWLTFAGVDGSAEVWLNRHFLGRNAAAEPFEFEMTDLLGSRNELVVEVESLSGYGGLWGEVALEIRCTAYLRAVRLGTTVTEESTTLHVTGEVAGTSERPLDLYVLMESKTVAYTTVEAAPEGKAFRVTAELPPNLHHMGVRSDRESGEQGSGEKPVRVELVNGAVVWYAVEQLLEWDHNNKRAQG